MSAKANQLIRRCILVLAGSDFELEHRAMAVATDVPSGQGTGHWSGATISFHNKAGVNQNACMGASVHLHYRTT